MMKTSPDYYTVVFASDARGMLPLTVAAYSLLENAAPGTHYDVVVLSDGIGPEERDELGKHLRPVMEGHQLRFMEVSETLPNDLTLGCRWPRVAWSRIFIPTMLPEVSKALYLDIDILVCDDLRELFETDLSGASAGVVLEHVSHEGSHFNERLGIPQSCPGYFNSGVMLMNLDFFRSHGLIDKVVAFARSHADVLSSPDQDALNAVLCDSLKRLHPRWNWHDGLTRIILRANPKAALWRGNTPPKALEAALHPGILHYQGPYKPWRYNHRLERRRYEQTMLRAGVVERLPLPGFNVADALKRFFYTPLYALTWYRIRRLAKRFGVV